MASNEWLVRKLHEQDKKIEALSRGGTGVGHTSIAPGENLTVISDNGEVVLGAGGVEHVDGPTPATPSAPTLKLGFGTIETTWDGTFAEGEDEDGVPLTAPVDFDVVEVHCSTDPEEEEWGEDTMRGQIKTREGGTITVGGFDVDDEVFVCLIALAKTGKRSAPSATASLVIEGLDFSQLFNEIDAANATIKNAGEVLVSEQGTLDEKLTEVDGTLNDLGQDLQAVEDAQAQLDTDLSDVMTSVDGKNTITWNPSAPSAVSTPGKAVGDLWYRTSGNSIIGFWKWDGTDWVTQLLDKTTIPLIDIGAGTFGFMKGSRLEAGSVTADRLVVGVSQNLVVDPKFKNDTINEARTTKGSLNTWDVVQSGTETWYRNKPGVPLNSRFFYLTTDGVSNNPETRMAVENTTKWSMSVDVMVEAGSAVRISRMQASLVAYKADGSAQFLAQNFTRPDGSLPVEIGEGWVTLRASYDWSTVSGVVSVAPRVYVTTGGTDGTYYFRNPNISEMVGTTLIEDAGITTPKLAADVLEVKNLKATTGQLDEAVINKLFSDVVVAKMAVAEQFIGENAILTGAVTAPKITASEELWAKIGEFVKIRAEHLEADAIDGMVITGPTIQSGRSGRRWIGDPNGIRIINEDDEVRTQLSPDGSTFKGEVEADTLVVNEGAEFKANNTLAQGSKLTLAAGVTDPTSPPVVQPYWDGLELSETLDGYRGLAFDGTSYITVIPNSRGTAPLSAVRYISGKKIDASTGVVSNLQCDFSGVPNPNGRVSEVFGVTCIGSELFFLGRYGYNGYVWVTDLDGGFKRQFPSPDIGYSATNPLEYRPGIGNDGTNVIVAQCGDGGQLGFNTVNKTTGAAISFVRDTSDATKSDITGVHVGNADWGRKLVTVAKASTSELPSFSPTTGAYDGAVTKFGAASPDSVGVVYADGKWRTLDPSGVIHEYADINTGDGSSDWWATYYWYTDVDDDNVIESSDYQSRMAPPKRFTWPRRAGLKILGQPMPTGVEALGPALAKKATTPVRTDFSGPGWQVDSGKPSARYVTLPTDWTTYASPSATNTFPEAESSSIESASGTYLVRGDGSGHWGPLKMGRNGVMSGLVVSGEVLVTPSAANTSTKFTVQLPGGRFTKPPIVWVQLSTSIPHQVQVGCYQPDTPNTFDLYLVRYNTTPTGVSWFAMDRE